MFVGHYAGAFLARAYDTRLPLAAAFVAAQLVDLGWDALIVAGVERARLVDGLPSNPLDLYFMPYTHSLAATVGWAAVSFGVVKGARLFGGATRVAFAFAAAVASHWVLDLLVHRPDLPLVSDTSTKLGLSLWNYPVLAFVLEIGVLAASAAIYVRRTGESARWIGAFVALLTAIQVATLVGPLPKAISAIAASLFATYVALAWAARTVQHRAAAERPRSPTAAA